MVLPLFHKTSTYSHMGWNYYAAGGFLYGLAIIIMKLAGAAVNAGYSSIMAVNLFMFGVLLCFMGLIGEYVGRIYISLNNAPQFVIKDYQESDEM